MRLLLVEDDVQLAQRLRKALAEEGFVVEHADNGVDAELMGNEEEFDAVVLDLGLPERPGLEVLRNWRRRGNGTPVLVLTVRDAWHERVEGLRAGADDYLGKPFHVEELVERLRALIRRSHDQVPGSIIRRGGLELDEQRRSVRLPDGREVALSGTEFRILRLFMLNPGRVLSKDWLEEHVYAGEEEHGSNVLEAHVHRLRKKIGHERIHTRRGQGYVFMGNDAS